MTQRIRGLLFDFDGLILDTETPEFAAWEECFRDHGCRLAPDAWAAGIGTYGGFDPYDHLARTRGRPLSEDERQETRRRVRERMEALIAREAARPGVQAYLDDARRLGLRTAIASSSDRAWIERYLAPLGLRDRFHAVVCRGDVPRVKPAPDLYLGALKALELGPHEAIALEDSPNGVAAAKAAGLFCVAVPHGPTVALDFSRADLVIPSLTALPLEDLLARVPRPA